jgi:hypothetical protein
MRRRIRSGKRRIGSSNGGGTRTLCTGGIEPHRRRGVGCPPIWPSSHLGSIELCQSSQVREVDVFSPTVATADFPCAPWNQAGVAQISIGSHRPNVESPPPTPIKIAAAESHRWRTTRECGAHRSMAFGVGEQWHWLGVHDGVGFMFSGSPPSEWWAEWWETLKGGGGCGFYSERPGVVSPSRLGSIDAVRLNQLGPCWVYTYAV